MGARGPAPKPTVQKRAAGNPGKRPLNNREPQLDVKLPICPAWLSKEAKAEYRRVGRQLLTLGLVTEIDRAGLAAYANAYARWMAAEKRVDEMGMVVKTVNGNDVQNPYLAIANRAMVDMRRLLVEFGMTPSSRGRVQTAYAAKGTGLEELLGAGEWAGEEKEGNEAVM